MKKLFLTLLAALALLPPLVSAQAPGVAVMWEARSYVPPLYEGKALYPRGGSFRAVAVPDASLGNQAALSYRWKVDGTVLGRVSGRASYAIDVQSTMFDPSPLVTVDVLDALDNVLAVGAVRIPFAEPQVIVYENEPLGGVQFGRAVRGTEPLNGEETTFEAYPYFFSSPSRLDPNLEYRWSVGGRSITETADPSITLQTPEGEGRAQVSLSVQNLRALVQRASASFSASFNNEESAASPLSFLAPFVAHAQDAKPVPLLTQDVPYLGNEYTPGGESLATYLSNLFLLGIGLILTGAVVMMTINALKGQAMSSVGSKMNLKDWGNDIWYAIGMVLALYVVLFAINPELTEFRLVETIQDAVRRAAEIVHEDEPTLPDEGSGNTTPPDGSYIYEEGMEEQLPDRSADLTSLMTCMASRLPGNAGRVSSISDCQIHGNCTPPKPQRTWQQCAAGQCTHTAGSPHYGGRRCTGRSYAVDFGDEQNIDDIRAAVRLCNLGATVGKHPNAGGGGHHVHVSVLPQECR